MKTEFRKMIQGVGAVLMLAVHTTAWGTNTQVLADDDFVVDVDNDTWIYSMGPTGCVEFAGYTIGESYHSLTNGAKIVCDDVVKCYTPTVSLDPPCHGIKSLNLCLSPLNHILVSMSASRVMDFRDRQELMGVGLSIFDDLVKHSGKTHPKFMFTAPHRPYWPSRKSIVNLWEGPLPRLYMANESMWPTSKIIFATSKTYVGDCIIHLKMGVANYDEYDLSFSASSKSAAAKSEKEFRTAFRAKHDGKTYEEWSKKRAQKEGGTGNNGNRMRKII